MLFIDRAHLTCDKEVENLFLYILSDTVYKHYQLKSLQYNET